MNSKTILQYTAAIVVCFLIGCAAALGLNAYDRHNERITPIAEGQTIDFSGLRLFSDRSG